MISKRSRNALSSPQVRNIWRYAVATDFHSFDPSIETDKQILEYGTEDRFLAFDHPIETPVLTCSLNSTGKLLAIVNKLNIDIYDLDLGEKTVLDVHASDIRKVGFSPTDPNLLVSWSGSIIGSMTRQQWRVGHSSDSDGIIIWNVEQQQSAQRPLNPIPIRQAAKAGVDAVIARLGDSLVLSSDEAKDMHGAFKSIIDRYDPRNRAPYTSRINGRIGISSQSPLFSHSGEYLIYAPGASLGGHASNTFHICLYKFSDRTTTTLVGHADSIIWAGFSPDDTLVASLGWSGETRVNNLEGKQILRWKTEGQIRAAIFSPDGKYLVTTNGPGMIKVWDITTGEATSEYDNGPRGCRTLDWSPDGRYLIAGSDSQGRLRLFAFMEGKIELIQERKLSLEKSNIASLGSNVRHMVNGFFAVQAAQFLPSHKEGSTKLAYTVSTDEGVEVFDLEQGKGWRFVPPYNEDGSVQSAADGSNASAGYIWRKDKEEIGIISSDGIRLWSLA